MARVNWTRDELIVAFNLYCRLPFGRLHRVNPEVIALANAIGRTPAAVAWKLVNFASIDPAITDTGRVGASHGGKLDAEVYREFTHDWERLSYESERLFAQMTQQSVEPLADQNIVDTFPEGKEREAVVKVRVNQRFFRAAVLAAYDLRCCISGLGVPELLNASHIIPWAANKDNRVNPRNGLCLNLVLDRAFDRGMFTVLPNLTIQISKTVSAAKQDSAVTELLLRYDGVLMQPPRRFMPEASFLDYHNKHIFRG